MLKKRIWNTFLSLAILLGVMGITPNIGNNTAYANNVPPAPSAGYNFTAAGNTGPWGPSQAQMNAAYGGTSLNGQVWVTGGGVQNWTVPASGVYKMIVAGAGGNSLLSTSYGGPGRILTGLVTLNKGETLNIIAGQTANGGTAACANGCLYGGGGGGGGSFVYRNGSPLEIAGGGGGGSGPSSTGNEHGYQYQTGSQTGGWYGGAGGVGATGTTAGNGGAGTGSGGSGGTAGVGGGSGYNTNWGYAVNSWRGTVTSGDVNGSTRGNSPSSYGYDNGGGGGFWQGNTNAGTTGGVGYSTIASGMNGGFGGGGAGGSTGYYCNTNYYFVPGSGGGGGYSGGGGASGASACQNGQAGGGGGGGSYTALTALDNTGTNPGGSNGYITILPISTTTISSPSDSSAFQISSQDYTWTSTSSYTNVTAYNIIMEELRPAGGWTTLSNINQNHTGAQGSAQTWRLNVPAGTPGNTQYRISITPYVGGYPGVTTQNVVTFANNITQVAATFPTIASDKQLSTALNKRLMNFSVNSIVDPDAFNYVKLFVDLLDGSGNVVAGSQKQLRTDYAGPVNKTTVDNFKLKVTPNFTAGVNNFNLSITETDGTTLLQSLLTKPMQPSTDAAPETYTLRVYGQDYQNSLNTALTANNLLVIRSVQFTMDSRNYVPSLASVVNDVNGRTMSTNQGFNKITFSGTVTDTDPADNVTLKYAVVPRSQESTYAINAPSDITIASIPNNGTGLINVPFSLTYTITDDLVNGDYTILVYGVDHRGGVGLRTKIPFTVNRTNPDIKFYATFGANTLSTAERQIVAKDSKLKIYFSAYDYVTLEYVGYQVTSANQKPSGTSVDLKIRGAFTNDVPSSFIGVDLSDPQFAKGDMLIFKFKAVSGTGQTIIKDVRVLIGDETTLLTGLDDTKVPTTLLP
jgi:hypothetical protein